VLWIWGVWIWILTVWLSEANLRVKTLNLKHLDTRLCTFSFATLSHLERNLDARLSFALLALLAILRGWWRVRSQSPFTIPVHNCERRSQNLKNKYEFYASFRILTPVRILLIWMSSGPFSYFFSMITLEIWKTTQEVSGLFLSRILFFWSKKIFWPNFKS